MPTKKAIIKTTVVLIWIIHSYSVFPQEISPVAWTFDTRTVAKDEALLTITAHVAPGWHLYSQHLEEGGPIPTQFTFQESDAYVRLGEMIEKGKQTKFFDEIYEIEITWYSETVIFQQRFRLNKQATVIRGKIEYMTCNDKICLPNEKEFSVDVKL